MHLIDCWVVTRTPSVKKSLFSFSISEFPNIPNLKSRSAYFWSYLDWHIQYQVLLYLSVYILNSHCIILSLSKNPYRFNMDACPDPKTGPYTVKAKPGTSSSLQNYCPCLFTNEPSKTDDSLSVAKDIKRGPVATTTIPLSKYREVVLLETKLLRNLKNPEIVCKNW